MSEQVVKEKVGFRYRPYAHQLPVWQARQKGYKRFISVWHRRGGKDLTFWNMAISEGLKRVGSYFYFFPTYTQGKKIVWDGSDNDGVRYVDYVPKQLIYSTNETELQVTLVHPTEKDKPGSVLQVIGADKMNHVVGTNPIGCIFSEYSVMRPSAWQLMDPVLAANGGWAAFAYTPRGRNHGFTLYDRALKLPGVWFTSLLTINDTRRHDGSPIVPLDYINQKRAEGADEDILQQEYYCSFNGAQQGSYYGPLLSSLEARGKVGVYQWDPALPVDTAWDIGVGDATAIWFFQELGDTVRLIDYAEEEGKGLDHFVKLLHAKPYVIRHNYAPHDIEVREWGNNAKTRLEMALELGLRFRVTPKTLVEDGIEAVRRLLPRCEFNRDTVEDGYNALTNYHKEYDEERACFKNKPEHDWTSHGADAFRILAQNVKSINRKYKGKPRNPITGDPLPTSYDNDFDPHEV